MTLGRGASPAGISAATGETRAATLVRRWTPELLVPTLAFVSSPLVVLSLSSDRSALRASWLGLCLRNKMTRGFEQTLVVWECNT